LTRRRAVGDGLQGQTYPVSVRRFKLTGFGAEIPTQNVLEVVERSDTVVGEALVGNEWYFSGNLPHGAVTGATALSVD
ncbi:MAG: hypothetical protein ACRD0I_07900, partial [Acidimicrobiales bacterium]